MSDHGFVEFDSVPPRLSPPQTEEEVLAYWEEIDAFRTSLKLSEGRPEFSFYDGPPFATGLPHYGHILASSIKDTVTRFAHATGHHVVRRFGWDCHGLPVEYEIDKKLGITGRDDVLKMGIDKYNAECRSIVTRYSKEWERIITRVGRWIDFENDYKTMDPSFMESVWWVFSELYAKGLVYQGSKVMPYSTACSTPLSNFEAGQNYKEVADPAVFVHFPMVDRPGVSLVAWTTTPWTLPSNLALCVNPTMQYVRLRDNTRNLELIMMEARVEALFPKKKKKKKKKGKGGDDKPETPKYEILEKFEGSTLIGERYEPLFDFFANTPESEQYFRVLGDGYVTSESGTGVVHQAPAFGEDDYRVCMEHGVITKHGELPCPVDMDGRFTARVPNWEGVHVKEADEAICKELKAAGRLVHKGTCVHNYPFCWRSDTPLIYRAIPSWFVDVSSMREELLANNATTYWVPAAVKEKRFANWLADARDWAISRNRFWGTPLPIWMSDDGEEIVVIGSVAQLEELSGESVTDLHRDSIDHITIPSQEGRGDLHRVDEVFDCWFESGSMPYAQRHYPFENSEAFEQDYFPADFIAEGLDQTRGWFYTLLVISTALFGKAPFKNLIVNGLVLAEDGKKMSKSKKNYPDPEKEIVNVYGADALRLYLISSPVVRAEPLRFVSSGVFDVLKDVFNPWYNAYRFFLGYMNRLQDDEGVPFRPGLAEAPTNITDIWIISELQSLIKFVRAEMAAYRLYTVVPRLLVFVEYLTNTWLRLNRSRCKGYVSPIDTQVSLAVLYRVLLTLCQTMAPFTPFLSEMYYQNLSKALPESERVDSVHYLLYPEVAEELIHTDIEQAVGAMNEVIVLARAIRSTINRGLKFPVLSIGIVHTDADFLTRLEPLVEYIKEEVNAEEVVLTQDHGTYVDLAAEPIHRPIGKQFGKLRKQIVAGIDAMDSAACLAFMESGSIEIAEQTLTAEHINVVFKTREDGGKWATRANGSLLVVIDTTTNDRLNEAGLVRDLISRVQKLRKSAGLDMADEADVYFTSGPETNATDFAATVIKYNETLVFKTLRRHIKHASAMSPHALELARETQNIDGQTFEIILHRPCITFDQTALTALAGDAAASLAAYIATLNYGALKKQYAGTDNAMMPVNLDGQVYDVVFGTHAFF